MTKELKKEIAAIRARASCLFTPDEVRQALDRMAVAITDRFSGRDPVLLCVMTGAVMTTTWLAERLDFPMQIDYVHLTRFDGATQGRREVDWIAEPRLPLAGRDVLLVDDIYDEGITLRQLIEYCRDQGAREIASVVLLRKQHNRDRGGIEPDIVGLEVEDRYIFGCGLDYKNYLRNLPAIYAVPEELDYL